jgi:hypothetical protein
MSFKVRAGGNKNFVRGFDPSFRRVTHHPPLSTGYTQKHAGKATIKQFNMQYRGCGKYFAQQNKSLVKTAVLFLPSVSP